MSRPEAFLETSAELNALLSDRGSPAARVMSQLTRWLKLRSLHKVFHPSSAQRIVDLGPEFFAVVRAAAGREVVCISNVSDRYIELKPDQRLKEISGAASASDILTGRRYMGEGKVIPFDAYQTVWLQR